MSCEIEQLERVYRLTYRFGNQAPTSKQFRFKGNLEEATTRARKHCKTMGYVYIFTSPFVVDLDKIPLLQRSIKLSIIFTFKSSFITSELFSASASPDPITNSHDTQSSISLTVSFVYAITTLPFFIASGVVCAFVV